MVAIIKTWRAILRENDIEKKRQLIKKILSELKVKGAFSSYETFAKLKSIPEFDTKYDILIEEMVPDEALGPRDNTKKLGIKF